MEGIAEHIKELTLYDDEETVSEHIKSTINKYTMWKSEFLKRVGKSLEAFTKRELHDLLIKEQIPVDWKSKIVLAHEKKQEKFRGQYPDVKLNEIDSKNKLSKTNRNVEINHSQKIYLADIINIYSNGGQGGETKINCTDIDDENRK